VYESMTAAVLRRTCNAVDSRTVRTLADLAEFVALAKELTVRGHAAFEADQMLRLAAEAILGRIGEAVGRLPEEFRIQHPEMNWAAIRGIRNLLSHEYHRIDYGIAWDTLVIGVPELAARLGLDG